MDRLPIDDGADAAVRNGDLAREPVDAIPNGFMNSSSRISPGCIGVSNCFRPIVTPQW
jgi:hypothetical protein